MIGRATRVCDSQYESDQHDPFPFVLQPLIVLVDCGRYPNPFLPSKSLLELLNMQSWPF